LLLSTAKQAGWSISESNVQVIHSIPIKVKSELDRSETSIVKEIVFIGPLDILHGLNIFCDAIDLVSSDLAINNIKVTFLGSRESVNGVASDEYIEFRSNNWKQSNVEWFIKTVEQTENDVISYFTDTSLGRVAISPALFDGSASVLATLLDMRVPFIASDNTAIKELISEKDAALVLIPAGSPIELSNRIRSNIGTHGKIKFYAVV